MSPDTIATIAIHLPDGAIREVPSGTTPLDIATAISPRLAAACVAARLKPLSVPQPDQLDCCAEKHTDEPSDEAAMYSASDEAAERIVDLTAPLTASVRLELIKENDP